MNKVYIDDNEEWDPPVSNKNNEIIDKEELTDNEEISDEEILTYTLSSNINDLINQAIINSNTNNISYWWLCPLKIIFKFNGTEFKDNTFGILIKKNINNIDIDNFFCSTDSDDYNTIYENIILFCDNELFIGTVNISKAVSITNSNIKIKQDSDNILVRINENFEINEELMTTDILNIININVFTKNMLSDSIISNIQNDISINPHNASLYIINSISSFLHKKYLEQYTLVNNNLNNNFLKNLLINFGETILQLLLSIDKLHKFNNVCHLKFQKFLNNQLNINENTKLEIANNILKNGFHFQEAWYTVFKKKPSISLKYVLFGGCFLNKEHIVNTPSYKILFESNNYIYINYEIWGWFRYHYIFINNEHTIFEEQLEPTYNYSDSPLLENGNWGVKTKIMYDTILYSTILKNCYLPSKINRFLKGMPLISSIQPYGTKHNPSSDSEYIHLEYDIIKQIKYPRELQVRYILNNIEIWRVYRNNKYIFYEWAIDSEDIIHSNDSLTQFKKIYNFFKTDDDWYTFRKKNINTINYVTFKTFLLPHFKNENIINEIWFRLIGPDGGDILYKYALKGRWNELRYSEKYKSLSSGIKIKNKLLLIPPKIKKWLLNTSLTELIVPDLVNIKNIYDKLIDLPSIIISIHEYYNYYETNEGLELSYLNSNEFKIWVYIDCDPIRNDNIFSYENIIIYNNNINYNVQKNNLLNLNITKLLNYYIKFPFINITNIIDSKIKNILFINLSEIYLINNIRFNTHNFIMEALTHSSLKLSSPTYHNMAIIGKNLINYIILEIILSKHNIYTPELIIFNNEDNFKNIISNDIKLNLEDFNNVNNLAHACINTTLYKHILHNDEKLHNLISSDDPTNYLNKNDIELEQILADVYAAYITAILFSNTRFNTFYQIKTFIIKTLINKTYLQKNKFNKKYLQKNNSNICKICDKLFNSDQQYKDHIIGQKHLKKLNKFKSENSTLESDIESDIETDIVSDTNSEPVIEKHIKSSNKASPSNKTCTSNKASSSTKCTKNKKSIESSKYNSPKDKSKDESKVLSYGGLWVEKDKKDKINKNIKSIKINHTHEYYQYYSDQYNLYLHNFKLHYNNESFEPLSFELFINYINNSYYY